MGGSNVFLFRKWRFQWWKACISAHQQRLRRCICHAHQRLIQRHIQHHAHCQYCCSKRCMSFCTFSCMHFYMQRQPDNERCLALFNGPLLCHDDLPTATPVPRQFLAKIWPQTANSWFSFNHDFLINEKWQECNRSTFWPLMQICQCGQLLNQYWTDNSHYILL